jgi:hypothetical protein
MMNRVYANDGAFFLMFSGAENLSGVENLWVALA